MRLYLRLYFVLEKPAVVVGDSPLMWEAPGYIQIPATLTQARKFIQGCREQGIVVCSDFPLGVL
jgi:hypothetical protein